MVNEIALFEELGVSQEEIETKWNDYIEASQWLEDFKGKFLEAVLNAGMKPGDYPVTLKTKYVDFQVIYPKQKTSFTINNDQMKATDIDVDIIDPVTGEVTKHRTNAYEWFKTKPKKSPGAYVKETKK